MERADPEKFVTIDPQRRPRALVVDDDATGRFVLKSLLARCGYEVTLADNGEDGIEYFRTERPDLVFMDVMMPVMDGREAAARIKALAGDNFVPIIFVTGATDERELVRCIEAGGDDVMVKPYSQTLLVAKVRAMERIRDLHRKVAMLYGRVQEDQVIAESVFRRVVMGENVAPKGLLGKFVAADVFSGDLQLAAYSPAGDLYVLFGDFTGHGLAAAIGALPTAATFRAMTAKGFSPAQILAEINHKLRDILPTGLFLAAEFVRVDRSLERVAVCNCGMPEAWIVAGGKVRRRMASRGLPLGVVADADYHEAFETVGIAPGESIVLVSDGAYELSAPGGELFGKERLEAALAGARDGALLEAMMAALEAFRAGAPLVDDISMSEIRCMPDLFVQRAEVQRTLSSSLSMLESAGNEARGWQISLELTGKTLRETEPVPLLISQLSELGGIDAHRSALFTVLTELYTNALDHGVLKLDSRVKAEPDGLDRYFDERTRRLEALREGCVRLSVASIPQAGGGRLAIRVEDSGMGFDWERLPETPEDAPYGRGIRLVRGLCESVVYNGPGNAVNAVYAWRTETAA